MARTMKRNEGQRNTHQTTSLETRALGEGRLRCSGGGSKGTRDIYLDGRVAVITRRRMYRLFVTQAERPMLVAGQLRLLLLLLLAEDLAVIRIVLYEDEEGAEGESETACPEEGNQGPESRGERRRRERFDLIVVGESKSGTVSE